MRTASRLRRNTARTVLVAVLPCAFAACGRLGYDVQPTASVMEAGAGGSRGAGGNPMEAGAGSPSDASAGGGAASFDARSDRSAEVTDAAGASDASLDGTAPEAGSVDASSDAPACLRPIAAPDYCMQLPALAAPPAIDGVLDCGLVTTPLSPLGWNKGDGGVPPVSADYAVAYRPDGLYFYVWVHDPDRVPPESTQEAWQGDGVELYFDADGVFSSAPAFDAPGARQLQATAPVDATTVSTRGELFAPGVAGALREPWSGPNHVAVPVADGYVVEAFVTASELGVPELVLSEGSHVGMDLGVNVSFADPTFVESTQGHRLGQFFLHLASAAPLPPFSNAAAFCTPELEP